MAKRQSHLRHLDSADDLETTYEAVRAGFVALALEKNRRATPFVAQARALKSIAAQAKKPSELLKIEEIQAALLTAAGVSDKALKHLLPEDKAEAVAGLIENFLEPAGAAFVEELVYRFLLTRGDTLGGSMRNVGGALAQRKLTRALLAALTLGGNSCRWLQAATNLWTEVQSENADIELSLRGLSWNQGRRQRTLIYNLTVPFLKNNVDLCLFDCAPANLSAAIYAEPKSYVALGELKGGIDPAGADEHWKTARTALVRIRESFSSYGLSPHTFFIGAAIEKKMASEIWEQLQRAELGNAANLTNEQQLTSIAQWLCRI
ncbi:MAG: AvaI/BsoBI family type II restriction endonuclease [Acidobacteriota bacterium]|nr:AvaI/BsoBI family type II restriction endonuclease [Acidobacteriota bacterium]